MGELINKMRFLEKRSMAYWKKIFGIFVISFCFLLLLFQMFILSILCALDKYLMLDAIEMEINSQMENE